MQLSLAYMGYFNYFENFDTQLILVIYIYAP